MSVKFTVVESDRLNPLSFGSLGRTPLIPPSSSRRVVLIPFHSGLWVEQAENPVSAAFKLS